MEGKKGDLGRHKKAKETKKTKKGKRSKKPKKVKKVENKMPTSMISKSSQSRSSFSSKENLELQFRAQDCAAVHVRRQEPAEGVTDYGREAAEKPEALSYCRGV